MTGVELIKTTVSLSRLFESVTRVERRGRNVFALCPFHVEKTPLCKIDDAKGFFYCFGCGAYGDAIIFYEKTKNLSFQEAVKELAGKAGVNVGNDNYKPSRKEKAERDRQREASLRKCESEQNAGWEATAVEASQV